jgi:hypothetical protein
LFENNYFSVLKNLFRTELFLEKVYKLLKTIHFVKNKTGVWLLIVILIVIISFLYIIFSATPSLSPTSGPHCGTGSFELTRSVGTSNQINYLPNPDLYLNQLAINAAKAVAESDASIKCKNGLILENLQQNANKAATEKCVGKGAIPAPGQPEYQLTCALETVAPKPITYSTTCEVFATSSYVVCTTICSITVDYSCKDIITGIPKKIN